MTDYQTERNQSRLQELQAMGYQFEIGNNGYSVKFKGKFIHGASVLLPRSKPLHWKHAKANRRNHLDQSVRIAEKHLSQNS